MACSVLFIIDYERFDCQVGAAGPRQGHQHRHQRSRQVQAQMRQDPAAVQAGAAEGGRLLQEHRGGEGRGKEGADPAPDFPALGRAGNVREPPEVQGLHPRLRPQIRILDIHLRRQLQADRPRLRTSRPGQERSGHERTSKQSSTRPTSSSRSSASRRRKGTSGPESRATRSTSRRGTGRSTRNTGTSQGLSSPSTRRTSPTPACRTGCARSCGCASRSRWTWRACWGRCPHWGWTTRGQFLLQEKQWADKHFMEGLRFLKAEKPDIALEHLNMARSFDKRSSKIYIARGCALANMNNFGEGLREIKEALRLSPDNKEALRYLDEIRKEMREKEHREREQEDHRGRKVRVSNEFQPARRK